MMLWKIAARNILRHKRRTMLSVIIIAIGVMYFVAFDSVLVGMDRGAIDNMITLTTAAVKIQTPAYLAEEDALPLENGVDDVGSIRKALAGNPRVKGVAPRSRFLGQLSVYTETMPVIGTVIDPAADSTVFELAAHVEGRYFSENNHREILLGSSLAEDLGIGIGDYVTLYALTRYESRNADDFEIVGLINTTDPSLNQASAFVTFGAAQEFLDLEGLVTEVNVALTRRPNLSDFEADAQTVKTLLESQLPNLTHQTFMEQAAGFLEISKGKRAFGVIFLGVITLIASVGIFNTVLMSVYERIREIGVLRAFGFKRKELTRLFMLEGLITGVVGAFAGVVLAFALNYYLVRYGYPVDKMLGDDISTGMPIWGTLYGEWNIASFVIAFVFTTVVATIAGLIPARKAANLEITQTLRFV